MMLTIKFDNMCLKFEQQCCILACVLAPLTTYNELYHHATNVYSMEGRAYQLQLINNSEPNL